MKSELHEDRVNTRVKKDSSGVAGTSLSHSLKSNALDQNIHSFSYIGGPAVTTE